MSLEPPTPQRGWRACWVPLIARMACAPLLLTYAALKIRVLAGGVTADLLQQFTFTQLVVYVTVLVELAGGLLLVLGLYTRVAAGVLTGFFLMLTLLMLPYALTGGEGAASYLDQMLKNVAIAGGLLLVALHGAGTLSLDHWRAARAVRPLR